MPDNSPSDNPKSLRQQAQERLHAEKEPVHLEPEDAVRALEELRIHQVELEIQNENLRTAQQQLIESRENYRDLFEFAPIPYLTLNDQCAITEANHAAALLLDTLGKRLINRPFPQFIEGQSLSAFHACQTAARRSHASRSCEILIRNGNSPVAVLLTIASHEAADTGNTIFRLTLDDLRQQKENERAIAKSKEYIASIVETVKNPLIVLSGSNFTIESANGAFYAMFGATAEESIGKKLEELNDGLLKDEQLLHRLAHTLNDGEELADYDIESALPQKGYRRLLLGARRIGTTDFMCEKVLVMVEDITERKAAENKIRELNENLRRRADELLRAYKEMEAFIYSVSHDLRGPLRTISGFAEMLNEDSGPALDETGKDYLNRIIGATGKMDRLIDDLLRLSRVSRQELHTSSMNLSAMVREILSELQSGSPDRKVEISIQDGIQVHADADLLRIALENLLQNAWKYTGKTEKAMIEFGLTRLRGVDACYIRDNGVGFEQKYAEKIFGAFQRLQPGADFPGTGIGLAIAKRIVEKHGGTIWATGEPGLGATIYFSLPS